MNTMKETKKVYVCASYARKSEAEKFAQALAGIEGYEIVSSWHSEPPNNDDGINDGLNEAQQRVFASQDLEEIDQSDILIAFTEHAGSPLGRGGRHVETGYALGVLVEVWVVGPVENIFHTLATRRFNDGSDALEALAREVQS